MNWKKIKLGDLFEQYRIEHIVQDDIDYGQITISKNGYIKFRTTKNGKSIGRKRQFIIDLKKYPNTLLFTRQGVADGAIAFAPKEVNNCIVTENMPMFSLKKGISVNFVKLLLKSEQYKNQIKKLIPTGSAQKSIHERDLMKISLYIPHEDEQKKLSDIIDKNLNNIKILNTELQTQQTLLKKLRQAILQEAIEGKLTASWREKNPNIESASVLLEKIKAEKEELIKAKKIRKQKTLPPIDKDEIPFEIPNGWGWSRLGNSGIFERGKSKHRPRNDSQLFTNGLYPFVQTGDVAQSKNYNYKVSTFSKKYNEFGLAQSRLWYKGTLCITIAANIAETGFLDIDACFPDSVVGFNSIDIQIAKYIQYFFFISKKDIEKYAPATAQKNINLGIINELIIPLPPFDELKQIVKKIESLFKLCDKLEEQIKSSKESSEKLMQSVLREAFEVEEK